MKETGGPNIQRFSSKTALKITLSWVCLFAASTCIAIMYKYPSRAWSHFASKAVQSPVQAPKAEAASQAGQVSACSLTVQHAVGAGRKTDCMQDKGLWSGWLGQAQSVGINKMCLCTQINDKTNCCPPKLQEQGLEEQGLTLLVGFLKYRDEH